MNESKYLQNTHFYIPDEYVSAMAQDANGNLSYFVGPNFSFDIIEQPFHCVIASVEGAVEFKLYVRSEMGAFLEMPDLGVKLFKEPQEDGKQLKVIANTGRIGDAGQILGIFLKVVEGISTYAEKNELVTELSNIDTESEGFLVKLNGDELSFNKVSGKARPDMACTTLFGGVQMMRPYQNEIMDSWMGEMLPLEEKIELAEDGDEEMMEQLANLYLNGDEEVDADPEQAVYWFTKLAELDNSDAQFNLGLHYAKGHGIERDFVKAAYWMQRAADNGDEDAPALLEKYTKAAEAIKKIDSGDAQAQADLAGVLMALAGSLEQAGTTEDDYTQAFELATKSAEQDNGDGIWALALCYEHGRGVAKNIDIAVELYERGADLGHAPSQHSLACYLFRGDYLEKNNKKAFELCMKSAQQGYGLAMADVGRCYQFGNGVMGNMKTAVEWYEKALEVIHDPELERKTAMFKMIGENDEHWGENYPGTDEEDFDDDFEDEESDFDLPDGFMLAMEAFEEAEEYENELADAGVIPDAPRPGNGVMNLSPEGFPRIAQKAEEGDERALEILAKMKAANELD